MHDVLEIDNGSKFVRADLHIHSYGETITKGSFDVTDVTMTPIDIVDTAIAEGLKIISITDHNCIGNVEEAVNYGNSKGILVIPGVEISTIQGHLLTYFDTFTNLSKFIGKLSIADNKETCSQGIVECLDIAGQYGGIGVLAHIELTSGFEKTIGRFGPPMENIFKNPNLFALEISHKDNIDLYTELDDKPERKGLLNLRKSTLDLPDTYSFPKLMSSDSHSLDKLGLNAEGNKRLTRIKIDELSFESFKIALLNHQARIKIEDFIPERIPRFLGLKIEGGLLDNQSVHFSDNLTCIIGGRGTGKSTLLESIRIGSGNHKDIRVVDSEVWPEKITLLYEDETGKQTTLVREKNNTVVNVSDSEGLTTIPIESYGQGDTAETIQHSGEDPGILLNFLDTFVDLKLLQSEESILIEKLAENHDSCQRLRLELKQVPDVKKALSDSQKKVEQLKADKVGELVKYHTSILEGKSFRESLTSDLKEKLKKYEDVLGDTSIFDSIAELKDDELIVGKDNFKNVQDVVAKFASTVDSTSSALKEELGIRLKEISSELSLWKTAEKEIYEKIEEKKEELSKKGIPFDLGLINRIISDNSHYQKKLNGLLKNEKELKDLETIRLKLLRERKDCKTKIFQFRSALGVKMTRNLKGTIEDFNVSVKYIQGSFSINFYNFLRSKLDYRTAGVKKAKAIVGSISPIDFAEKIHKRDITFLKDLEDNEVKLFDNNEISRIQSIFELDHLYEDLEHMNFEDFPLITLTKVIPPQSGGEPVIISKKLDQLSLGQQQSILLAILLHSDTNFPLIIDQPEDNLDSAFIYNTIVANLKTIKEKRQVIIVTHNANIPVLGDAELIIPLKSTNSLSLISDRGSIDKKETKALSCQILEGGKRAFTKRKDIYGL